MYVIICTQGRHAGRYVTKPGSDNSYTPNIQNAGLFKTRDAAEREKCVDNEKVVDLSDIFS
jgi:hypothetical protein